MATCTYIAVVSLDVQSFIFQLYARLLDFTVTYIRGRTYRPSNRGCAIVFCTKYVSGSPQNKLFMATCTYIRAVSLECQSFVFKFYLRLLDFTEARLESTRIGRKMADVPLSFSQKRYPVHSKINNLWLHLHTPTLGIYAETMSCSLSQSFHILSVKLNTVAYYRTRYIRTALMRVDTPPAIAASSHHFTE